ncbi:MAG: VWA domain-containing protein [Candidatus Melainabacteria bacterium]|nr:VWA domain-containing protein [Candidatus Melainabacteria bacterium]
MSNRKTLSLVMAAAAVLSTVSSSALPVNAKEAGDRPHMDLAFCIDTTGSMQHEIDMVKTKTKELVAKLSTGKPAPIVRVGLVAYRDRGDEYVTKVFPFSDNIDQVVKDISSLKAAGGGDGPESVNEGLHVALNSLDWGTDKGTAKLLFLIGDAGPHDYPGDYKWDDESKKAIARGIQVNTIACSGLENYPGTRGVDVFKQIAKLTDGKYDTLAYRSEIVDASGKRETVVTAAGATYKMRAGEKDWKAAAADGRMDKTVITAASPMPMTSAIGGKFLSRRSYAPSAARAELSLTSESFAGMAAGSGGGASYNAPSRSDSNLDEIVLGAARAKAKKQLNVSY